MTRASAPPILLQLHSPESVSAQVTSLRNLKNELIGHDQRKEAYVNAGVIPALAQVLTSRRPTEFNGSIQEKSKSEELEACLQAILIVGSLAQGM
jgi:hypothetical protein